MTTQQANEEYQLRRGQIDRQIEKLQKVLARFDKEQAKNPKDRGFIETTTYIADRLFYILLDL